MILIADSGSSNTTWALIGEGGVLHSFTTEGYNPFFVNSNYIKQSLQKKLPGKLDPDKVTKISFYGAGCMDNKINILKNGLKSIFKNANINVHLDLLAAARAVLGGGPGFTAILGTGTNSCLYNGKEITHNVESLGYFLGDEGSGCYIGKRLISEYIRGSMPADIRKKFWQKYKLPPDELMEQVYSQDLVSRFCAGFTRFLTSENMRNEYLYQLVKDCFISFFVNLVSLYPHYSDYTFNCIGSIGYNFRNVLEEVAGEHGMKCGRIEQSPLEGLVNYHLKASVE